MDEVLRVRECRGEAMTEMNGRCCKGLCPEAPVTFRHKRVGQLNHRSMEEGRDKLGRLRGYDIEFERQNF